jgi:hypothetical protein
VITGGQIRAARALLRWSVETLAGKTSLGLNTIKRAEARDGRTSLTAANELAIRGAFEAGGIEFTNGDQPGVRLSKAAAARTTAPPTSTAVSNLGRAKTGRANKPK